MIRDIDFEIEIGWADGGTFIRATHLPTGVQKIAAAVAEGEVGTTRDRLLQELLRMVYDPSKFRIERFYASADDVRGAIYRVTHLPTGLSKFTQPRSGKKPDDLVDEILDELHAAGRLNVR